MANLHNEDTQLGPGMNKTELDLQPGGENTQ